MDFLTKSFRFNISLGYVFVITACLQAVYIAGRYKADKKLEKFASRRLTSSNSLIADKMVALGVKGANEN